MNMEKLWYRCGTMADDGFEVPMELTPSEATTIYEFLEKLESKNKWSDYCGNTWINMNTAYKTEDECWENCDNKQHRNDDEIPL